MPPPANQSDTNPVAQAQLLELNSAISQLAHLAHANNRHFIKVGENAEQFARTLSEARRDFSRSYKELLVAIHFGSEYFTRLGRSGGAEGGGGQGPRNRGLQDVRSRYRDLRREGVVASTYRARSQQLIGEHAIHAGQLPPSRTVSASLVGRDRREHRRDASFATPGTGSGLSPLRALGAAAAGAAIFTQALEVAAAGARSFAAAATSMVQAASPQTWKTFTGSFELLMAQVGRGLVPTFVRLALAAQALSEKFGQLSQAEVENKLKGAGATAIDYGMMMNPVSGLFNAGYKAFGGPGLGRDLMNAGAQAVKGLDVPKDSALYVKTAEPRVSAVESVWEQMLSGFLGEDELTKRLVEINQAMLEQMTRTANEAEKGRKPGT